MPEKKKIRYIVGARTIRQTKLAKPRKRLNVRRLKETGFFALASLNARRVARVPTKVKIFSLPDLIFKQH